MSPRPGPPPGPPRWNQERPSEYPWEQDGLDHVRRLLPDAEPFRAWATFSFTASSGRIHECDLLVAVPGGLYLVELKAHPGRVVSHGDTWTFSEPGSSRVRTLRNPLHFTDAKSKDLKSRLEGAARKLRLNVRLPRVEPAIFLTDPGLRADLDEVQRVRVYGRDDAAEGLPWIWRDLLTAPPARPQQRIQPDFSRTVLPRLLAEAGIRASTAHLRFGDDWQLAPSVLDAGPHWEDRLAERRGIVRESGRVRIYLTQLAAGEEQRRGVERAARREYQVLQGIAHRGIAQAVQIQEHQGGPAILFRHEAADLRLDSYLAVHRPTAEVRLDLVRQLAEAVRYAHSRELYHRALSASSVYVSARDDGADPVLRVIDWQAAVREFDTTMSTSLGATSLGEHVVTDAAGPYLAPESDTDFPDPGDLDVFGLGALAYLLLTGEPPAVSRGGLIERVTAEGGLHPVGVTDGIVDDLDALVFDATRADTALRLESADAFLGRLDLIERGVAMPEPTSPGADPLVAGVGQMLDGDWEVARVLGTGATARAVLVARLRELDDGEIAVEHRVLKIALDEDKAASLHAEARALAQVGGAHIVRLLDGPRLLGGRTVLDLQYAGGDDLTGGTLGALLRGEGRLSYHDLERFGGDLFAALDQLVAQGVRHRDLKPDNFAVFRRADRSRQLMLLDFSLSAASERDIGAGTRGYVDPFLGTVRRPAFDDHAERYAAAVTLHEMASMSRPVWGDGATDPRATDEPTPDLAVEQFDPALREGLTAFFLRAFHRDADRRFETFRHMQEAWRGVFLAADAVAPATTPTTVGLDAQGLEQERDAAAAAAGLDTPLDAAGLSPRAISVAQSFGAATVGGLLRVRRHEIAKARGAGSVIRKELNRRHRQWGPLLDRPVIEVVEGAPLTIDDMAQLLLPTQVRRASRRAEVVGLLLGVADGASPWATQGDIARRLGITQAAVSRHCQSAAEDWAEMDWLGLVRDELAELLVGAGRIMVAAELTTALRVRHGSGAEHADQSPAAAQAVLRAAVEAETRADHGDDDPDGGPRFVVLRRGGRVFVALDSLPGMTEPSAAELADFAHALGGRADVLAEGEPMPGRGVVVRELRAIAPPDGLAPLADTRLVPLAAAASGDALVSARLELYPRGLDLVTALRVSQAAAGVRRPHGITPADLLAKVRARFPELRLPDGLTYVSVQSALRDAGFPLDYDLGVQAFLPPAPDAARPSRSSSSTLLARPFTSGLDPHEVIATGLSTAVDRGGFLALTLRGRHLPGAAAALSAAYPVREVDVGALFLTEFRTLVAARGQDWGKVLATDARFSETGRLSPGLASYVQASWTAVRDRLHADLDPAAVLFLHDAGLLGRYAAAGGHELLVDLQARARRAAGAPHGLWLLCPGESASGEPQLDGWTVEVLGPTERWALDGEFLDGLRARADRVA